MTEDSLTIPRGFRPRRRAMWFIARMTVITALLVAVGVPVGGPPAPGVIHQVSRTDSIDASAAADPLLVTSGTLPGADKDVAYTHTLTATGGVTPYVWSLSIGSLPTGITLNSSTGVLSGTPTTAGNTNVTFKVTDANNSFGLKKSTFTVVNGPSLTYTSPLTDGEVGVSYTKQLTKTGGTAPDTWSVSTGALPAGLTLGSSTGLLFGTPTESASATFTVSVTDRWNQTASKSTSLTVIAAPSMTFAAPSSGVVGTAYSTTFTSTGGSGSNVWSVSTGSPPAGLTLNSSTGVLSGTPTTAGTTNFTVKVTDVNGGFATGAVSLVTKQTASVSLSSSAASMTFGTSVTLTATVTPSAATGTVTFTDVPASGPDNGNTVTLGSGTISGGVADTDRSPARVRGQPGHRPLRR